MHNVLEGQKIVLFDGICNLCNASVVFILKRERRPEFKFASIQSEAGKNLLSRYGLPPDYAEAVLLIQDGKIHFGSSAALNIGQTKIPLVFICYPWTGCSKVPA